MKSSRNGSVNDKPQLYDTNDRPTTTNDDDVVRTYDDDARRARRRRTTYGTYRRTVVRTVTYRTVRYVTLLIRYVTVTTLPTVRYYRLHLT